MTTRLFMVRCGRCNDSRHITGTLEFARMAVCDSCRQRMTVVGHESPPSEGAAVTTAPGIETPFWKLTEREQTQARRLALSALEE